MARAKKTPVAEVPVKEDTGKKLLELVEFIHKEKKVSREVVFSGIESAVALAAARHFAVEEGILVHIDRSTGDILARKGEETIDPVTLGRIAAQSAKQVMIQKIREAESDTTFGEFAGRKGELVTGTIQRIDAGTAIVALDKTEALLPRSEQIPGETHHLGERIQAIVHEVRKTGHRVKIVLSRAHGEFVRALFNKEIPEIDDRTIEIRAISREAGYRTKVAVSSLDSKVDCVGACVGVRGSRIKNIIEELNGERIDIVRWNEMPQILLSNALSPATVADVFTYPRLGRAIVLVNEDQLSLAIGRRGQNVRLASKLVGMDIEIMTHDELGESLERAESWFRLLPTADVLEGEEPPLLGEEPVQALIEEGFLSYNEVTFIGPEELAEFTGLTLEQAEVVIGYAEENADFMEQSIREDRAAAEEAAIEAKARGNAPQVQQDQEEDAEAGVVDELPAEDQLPDDANIPQESVSELHAATKHPSMPTDVQGVEEALIHEEQRSGEDGEITTNEEAAQS